MPTPSSRAPTCGPAAQRPRRPARLQFGRGSEGQQASAHLEQPESSSAGHAARRVTRGPGREARGPRNQKDSNAGPPPGGGDAALSSSGVTGPSGTFPAAHTTAGGREGGRGHHQVVPYNPTAEHSLRGITGSSRLSEDETLQAEAGGPRPGRVGKCVQGPALENCQESLSDSDARASSTARTTPMRGPVWTQTCHGPHVRKQWRESSENCQFPLMGVTSHFSLLSPFQLLL